MLMHTNDSMEYDLVCETLQNLESTIYYYTIDYKDEGRKCVIVWEFTSNISVRKCEHCHILMLL